MVYIFFKLFFLVLMISKKKLQQFLAYIYNKFWSFLLPKSAFLFFPLTLNPCLPTRPFLTFFRLCRSVSVCLFLYVSVSLCVPFAPHVYLCVYLSLACFLSHLCVYDPLRLFMVAFRSMGGDLLLEHEQLIRNTT